MDSHIVDAAYDIRQSPLISVIIPAYNAAAFLERCVDSVLRQTLTDLEIIVVDDGSHDDTGQLCDCLASRCSRVKVIHRENGGLSAARNTGIDNARGRLLFFLDSDDYIAPGELEALYRVMLETGAPIVVGGIVNVEESGDYISTVVVEPCVVDEHGFWSGYGIGTKTEEHGEYVVSCGKLIDRSVFEHERFDVGKIHEDEFIIHRLVARAKKVAFADVSGYYYVQTEGSIMHSPSPSAFMDTAEALIARARYLAERGWWDFSLTAVCEARGALSNSAEADRATLRDERFRMLKQEWRGVLCKVSPRVPRCRGPKALCALFSFSPSLYMSLKKNR